MSDAEAYLTWATAFALLICAVAFAVALGSIEGLRDFLGAVL